MIQEFVKRFEENKEALREIYRESHPKSYKEIVKNTISLISPEYDYGQPNHDDIRSLDFGDYQGTILFIIPAYGYQPSDFWAVNVNYGSCSHCDTLESIRGYTDDKPTEDQVSDYMNLSLHVVQGITKIGSEE